MLRLRLWPPAALLLLSSCGGEEPGAIVVLPGSAVGAEAEVLRLQLDRFMRQHPDIQVVQRTTPDAADQRHQLYVQWLNAGASEPDVLQLDVIWTPEFAAAGWILPLSRFHPDTSQFFTACNEANTWKGELYALPWFVDVGLLYWRTDLMEAPPANLDELVRLAREGQALADVPHGLVWQGARYEGLVCVFLEHLGIFGGEILDREGRVVVDSEAGIRALSFMERSIRETRIVPEAVLTWQEEQTRFAFQNGQAVFMRNWPYAYPLMNDSTTSKVAGRFAVMPMPASEAGHPTAALGGSQLAINARSKHPEAAFAVIEYLTRPEQMMERARVAGQYPTRPALYDDPALSDALAIPPADARRAIEQAVPRPVTPVYTELSSALQVGLHRALTGQERSPAALTSAAREIEALLARSRTGPAP